MAQESAEGNYNLGNCAESVPWELLSGQAEIQKEECNHVLAKHEHKYGGDEPMFKMSGSSKQNELEGLGHNVPMVSMVVDT